MRRWFRKFAKRARRYADRIVLNLGQRPAQKARAMLVSAAALVMALLVLLTALLARRCSEPAAGGGRYLVLEEIDVPPTPVPMPAPSPTPEPILHRGVESEDVHPLQERLIELGYMEWDGDTTSFFGPVTELGVELFQRQINFTEELGVRLDEDGWAGERTLALLYGGDAPQYCVKEGMRGEDITLMQQQLVDMGYMRRTTGYYGDETVAAVREFQERNGLAADGMTGVKTYEMLYSSEAKESRSKAKRARTKANISEMVAAAKDRMGCEYIRGHTGPKSFDCSGLVYYCLKKAGSSRRRLSAAGYSRVGDWEKISGMRSLKKGDLIFFYDNGFTKVGHVGIVIYSGMMIDASSRNGKVVKRSYEKSYWKEHFVCGRRPW